MKTTRVRGVSAALAIAGMVAASAACSAGSHPAPHVPGAMVDPPIGKIFDGPTLAGMLGNLTYPPGFSPDPQSVANSGLEMAPHQDFSVLTSQTCSALTVALGNWGYGESSYASAGAVTGNYGRALSVFVYQFASNSGASLFYSAATTQWSSCGTFTDGLSGAAQPAVMIAAPAPAVWGTSKAVDLSLTKTLGGTENTTDYVMGLDGNTVVFGQVATSPGPEFTGGVQQAAGMAGDLLQEMNAAQLATSAPEAGSVGRSQPHGRYGTGN